MSAIIYKMALVTTRRILISLHFLHTHNYVIFVYLRQNILQYHERKHFFVISFIPGIQI